VPEEESKNMGLVSMVSTAELILEFHRRFDEVLIIGRTRKGIKEGERRVMSSNVSCSAARGMAEKARIFYDGAMEMEVHEEYQALGMISVMRDDDDDEQEYPSETTD
jgi:replicative superfamily II helicase